MNDHELDKTFVERSPSTLIPPAFGGSSVPQTNARPIVGQTRLGTSVVTEIIGEGGMATVYKVWNDGLEVFRAVKLLSHEAFSARFETEAKITAKLHHEGIVEIHSIGEWNGLPYMEMEFVDGFDLQQMLAERGKLPEIVCVAVATKVAEALAHAHTKTFTLVGKQYCGIIHRDLKPANIMISKNGDVKLTDFGIARPAQTSLHTIEGNIAGTMHYLSPEQMNGGEVDNRSDIYSFGTILYEIVTGAKTFPQGSIIELMKQKSANKFKSPYEFGAPINDDLVRIILRCLKFVPAKRYQRTQELVDDLQELNASLTKQAPKEVLENYLNGIEADTHKDIRKTKQLWILGKSKPAEQPARPKTPEPDEKPQPVKTTDKPEVAKSSETPKTAETPAKPVKPTPTKARWSKMTRVSAIPVRSLLAILIIPQWIWSKIKLVKTLTKPKLVKTPAKPKPPKPKTPKISTISTKSLRIFLAPLLLLAVVLLSYITIRAFTAKALPTKPPKTLIGATIADDTTMLTQKTPNDTIGTNKKSDTTIATVTKSIPIEPATSAPPKKPPVATDPLDSAITVPDPMSESEQLRAAIAAGNAKKWDQAIEILEQGGVFKEKYDQRTLYLLNAYVESRRFDKAQAIMNVATATLSQDTYFNLCAGKFWYYQGSHDKALKYLALSLNNSSIINTDKVLPNAALYLIADIKQDRFKASPSASNRSAALEAWREVRNVYILKPNDSRAKRAEREISALEAGN